MKKYSNIYLLCLKLSCLSEFYKKKKRTQLSELTNHISSGAFDRTFATPADYNIYGQKYNENMNLYLFYLIASSSDIHLSVRSISSLIFYAKFPMNVSFLCRADGASKKLISGAVCIARMAGELCTAVIGLRMVIQHLIG